MWVGKWGIDNSKKSHAGTRIRKQATFDRGGDFEGKESGRVEQARKWTKQQVPAIKGGVISAKSFRKKGQQVAEYVLTKRGIKKLVPATGKGNRSIVRVKKRGQR